jgi:hypothetical protein
MPIERLSIALTNHCTKACWFCYAGSTPAGSTRWTVAEVADLVRDCAARGVKAVSFGGGEPLEFEGLFDLLTRLRGLLFRSLTTNGLSLSGETLDRLVEAAPDKVHVSVHFPSDVERVVDTVHLLDSRGLRAGVNLLVPRSQLEAATESAAAVRRAGIGNDRIVYLPMRGQDTPTPEQVAQVAGSERFQSMSCLAACGPSPRFASISWDRTVAWCSYTTARRPLEQLSYDGVTAGLRNLGIDFCGGTDEGSVVRLPGRPQHGLRVVRGGP